MRDGWRRGAGLLLVAVVSGFVAACGLLLPWMTTGSRSRSTIELIGSAGALEVFDDATRVAIVAVWFAVPVVVAGAGLAAASGRRRLAAALLLPVGGLVVVGMVLVATSSAGSVAWGAWVTVAAGVVSAGSAATVLVMER